MEKVKRLIPDHSVSDWDPSHAMRKESAFSLFRHQPDECGWNEGRQKNHKRASTV